MISLPPRKATVNRKRLSKLLNGQWAITLDPKEFRFRLQPSVKIKDFKLTMKQLSSKDVQRFGTESKHSKISHRRDDESYSCVACDLWLDGLCFKHPTIFVKENIPPKMPYNVFETFPPFMYLDKSTIPGAGNGVFTSIDLPTGVAFGPYSGVLSFTKEAEKSGYSWALICPDVRRVWVDAIDVHWSNWMRYSNSARYEQEQNVIAVLYNQNIYYYTYKPIPANTELLTWYGAEYGKCLKIPKAEKMRGSKAPTKKMNRPKFFRTKA